MSKFSRNKAHVKYRTENGTLVPGVTTILGIINKPQLVKWANNLGLEGIDSEKYVHNTARIGTLAHEMIAEYCGGESWNRGEYSPLEVATAESAFDNFEKWWDAVGGADPIEVERSFVSEVYLYGGTIDFYGIVGGKRCLVDFKTCNNLYPEHSLQVAAYWKLLVEHGFVVDNVMILRIGKDNGEGYEQKILGVQEVENCFEAFDIARRLHLAMKILRKGE